ncbi:prephenate dehydratase [compost metagenome]
MVSEAWRPIRLALLGLPEARLSDIRTAESHPVALQQCSKALGELKIASVEVFDTGGAAAAVAEAGDLTRAASTAARKCPGTRWSTMR